MKKFLVPIALAVVATGCAPDPDDICKQEEAIFAASTSAPSYLEKRDRCVEKMEKRKKNWGVNGYRRYAECILQADSQFKAQRCLEAEVRRSGPE